MIDVLIGYDEMVGNWVASKIRDVQTADEFNPFVSIGFGREGKIVGGVVYYNFTGDDVFANIAMDDKRCLNRSNLYTIFAYPFLDQGVHRITVYCAKGNKKARKLAQAMGFRQEGVLRQAIDKKHDAVVYGMLKSECKWIERHGKEISTKAA